ncbi:SDR family NAD(P)-dependent oxidoreductase [Wenxinia saemankumensis]|uniref:Short-chain dehydrogenase n=1 Tax=Wenxinia saemankumensis TaxID=1447782 RepID=A0A1M6DYZ4_9RHOB|nr:SDR family NAD(P)-dependent oxidoreductase [Wenxinia saemankumensis]SHI78360.1 Short-chain dehydrogenase [Wenxinia saemankumensis]
MRALVLGASGGIGAALVAALQGRGAEVTGLSRSRDGFDVTDPDAAARGLEGRGTFDLVLLAFGILGAAPEKALAQIDAGEMARVMAVDAVGVGTVLSHVPDLLDRDGAGKVGVLTARVGSIGDNRIGGWHSYRAAKAAANMLVRGAAIELARSHKGATCVALHPGTVETPFTAGYPGHRKVSAAEAAGNLLDVLKGLGPERSGGFYDYAGKEIPW